MPPQRTVVIIVKCMRKLNDNLYIPDNFSENHRYYADEKGKTQYTGVTTVLGVIAKPALVGWAANQACDYIEKNFPTAEQLFEKPTIFTELIKEARTAWRKKRDKAADSGTNVHETLEGMIKDAIAKDGYLPETKSEEKQIQHFINWAVENKVKFLECEKVLYDKENFIAGTADGVLEMDGKKYVYDIKTGKGVYQEAWWQMGAYRMMLEKMGHDNFHGSLIIHLPEKGELKTYERYDIDTDKEAFMCALRLYRIKQQNEIH